MLDSMLSYIYLFLKKTKMQDKNPKDKTPTKHLASHSTFCCITWTYRTQVPSREGVKEHSRAGLYGGLLKWPGGCWRHGKAAVRHLWMAAATRGWSWGL